jgi:hypothetical protein
MKCDVRHLHRYRRASEGEILNMWAAKDLGHLDGPGPLFWAGDCLRRL